MKRKLYNIYFIAGILIMNSSILCNLSAQNDTVIFEYTQVSVDSSGYTYKLKYKYLNNNLVEEKNLLTLDFIGLSYIYGLNNDVYRLVTDKINSVFLISSGLSFEHKINPCWSAGLTNSFSFQKNGDYYNSFTTSTNLIFRYFYGKKTEIRNKISANNFNGSYIGLSLSGLRFHSMKLKSLTDSITINPASDNNLSFYPGFALSFAPYAGYYYDMDFRRNYYQLGLRIKAGLGYGFK